jgi:hypothetical protein
MTAILVLFTVLSWGATPQKEGQETPKIPKDSVRLVVTGCLKGRVLHVDDTRQPDVQGGFPISARSFRLAGKKEVMNDVKKQDKRLVEVEGLVKQSSLAEPGVKIGKGITISGGSSTTGTGRTPPPTEYIPVLDAWSVQQKGGTCR